jgi:hypothetical protein
MELLNLDEFEEYVRSNFDLLYEADTSELKTEIDSHCDSCQRDVFMKIHSRTYQQAYYRDSGLPDFVTYFFECPRCKRKAFIKIVRIGIEKPTGKKDEFGDDETQFLLQHYRLFRLPTKEENYVNKEIPAEHTTLKNTVIEANFCLTHSKYLSAAILFRRAIQIIAKDILGATGKTLFLQLEWLKNNKNKLGIDLGEVFHDNSKIIKDIGNQGAHPDDDITLHNFTKEDANGLHDLFISIIHELFVKPIKLKAIQEELKQNRKLI